MGSVAVAALISSTAVAFAGGFAVREQSTEFQGMSFAGSAAMGGGIGSMFWNPAATANKEGFNTESNYALIIPDAEIHTKAGTSAFLNGLSNDSGNIAQMAIVPASYMTYQFKNYDPNLFVGLGINAPFGLTTEPENSNYKGAVLGRTSHLFTLNFNPTIAYRVNPAITIGAGLQVMYSYGQFKFANFSGTPGVLLPGSSGFEGNDISVGATAGINFSPAAGTNIGLGYRSQMTQTLEGDFFTPRGTLGAEVELKLPDIVTLSLRQAVAPNMRLLGTVEWTQWSRFDELRVKSANSGASLAVIPANWSDSWLFSVGGEYDVNRALTLRTGVGYEISPVDDPTKRISGIPDSDRIWASIGASYKYSESTTIELAYTHIFLKDEELRRTSLQGLAVVADVEAKTDIISVALKTRW
jgi:long-chain fatty acid transport protein